MLRQIFLASLIQIPLFANDVIIVENNKVGIGLDQNESPTSKLHIKGDKTLIDTELEVKKDAVFESDVEIQGLLNISSPLSISNGSIDGTVIGATTASSARFTTLEAASADINGGSLSDIDISNAGTATIQTLTIGSSLNVPSKSVDADDLNLGEAEFVIGRDGSNSPAATTISGIININQAGVASFIGAPVNNSHLSGGITLDKLTEVVLSQTNEVSGITNKSFVAPNLSNAIIDGGTIGQTTPVSAAAMDTLTVNTSFDLPDDEILEDIQLDKGELILGVVNDGFATKGFLNADEFEIEVGTGRVYIRDDAIHSSEIKDGEVKTNDIGSLAVTADKIALNAITSDQVADDSINQSVIAPNAIGTTELLDGDIQEIDLAVNSVSSIKIQPLAITTGKINPAAITTEKIDDHAITSIKIQDNSITSADIANGSITSSDLAANSVGLSQMLNDSVGVHEIRTDAVGASEIVANAVGNSEMQDNAIGLAEMRDNAIGSNEVINNSLTANDLATNSVNVDEIAAGAVRSSEVLDNSLTASDLAPNSVGGSELVDDIWISTLDISNTIDMNSKKITRLATPTASTDAATKGYVDSKDYLFSSGSSHIDIGNIRMCWFRGSGRRPNNDTQTNGSSYYGTQITENFPVSFGSVFSVQITSFGHVDVWGDSYFTVQSFSNSSVTAMHFRTRYGAGNHAPQYFVIGTKPSTTSSSSYIDIGQIRICWFTGTARDAFFVQQYETDYKGTSQITENFPVSFGTVHSVQITSKGNVNAEGDSYFTVESFTNSSAVIRQFRSTYGSGQHAPQFLIIGTVP